MVLNGYWNHRSIYGYDHRILIYMHLIGIFHGIYSYPMESNRDIIYGNSMESNGYWNHRSI